MFGRYFISAVLASFALLNAASGEEKKDYPFFPFCIDWHDAKHRNFEEQAVMLKELGYDGVGHIWLDKVDERIKTLDDKGLKLYQITMEVNVSPPDKPAYDPRSSRRFSRWSKGGKCSFACW